MSLAVPQCIQAEISKRFGLNTCPHFGHLYVLLMMILCATARIITVMIIAGIQTTYHGRYVLCSNQCTSTMQEQSERQSAARIMIRKNFFIFAPFGNSQTKALSAEYPQKYIAPLLRIFQTSNKTLRYRGYAIPFFQYAEIFPCIPCVLPTRL